MANNRLPAKPTNLTTVLARPAVIAAVGFSLAGLLFSPREARLSLCTEVADED